MNQSYYKGHTKDLENRLGRHNRGEESFTNKYIPWKLIWCCEKPTKQEAYALEMKLKNLSRTKLEAFILKYMNAELLNRFRPWRSAKLRSGQDY